MWHWRLCNLQSLYSTGLSVGTACRLRQSLLHWEVLLLKCLEGDQTLATLSGSHVQSAASCLLQASCILFCVAAVVTAAPSGCQAKAHVHACRSCQAEQLGAGLLASCLRLWLQAPSGSEAGLCADQQAQSASHCPQCLPAGNAQQLGSTLAVLNGNGSASSCLQGAMLWAAAQAAEPANAIAAIEVTAASQNQSTAQIIAAALSSSASVSCSATGEMSCWRRWQPTGPGVASCTSGLPRCGLAARHTPDADAHCCHAGAECYD